MSAQLWAQCVRVHFKHSTSESKINLRTKSNTEVCVYVCGWLGMTFCVEKYVQCIVHICILGLMCVCMYVWSKTILYINTHTDAITFLMPVPIKYLLQSQYTHTHTLTHSHIILALVVYNSDSVVFFCVLDHLIFIFKDIFYKYRLCYVHIIIIIIM